MGMREAPGAATKYFHVQYSTLSAGLCFYKFRIHVNPGSDPLFQGVSESQPPRRVARTSKNACTSQQQLALLHVT